MVDRRLLVALVGILLTAAIAAPVLSMDSQPDAVAAEGSGLETTATQDDVTPTVIAEDVVVREDGNRTIDLSLSAAPRGLAGYDLQVLVSPTSGNEIVNATPGSEFELGDAAADSTTQKRITGVDLTEQVQPGATDIDLGSVTIDGGSDSGTLEIRVHRIDDEDGTPYRPDVENATITVTDDVFVTVDDDGGAQFRSIQAAIDAVPPGQEIRVSPGSYPEAVTIDKNVTLVAPDGATLDGRGTENSAVMIQSDRPIAPTIDGFRITDWELGVQAPDADGNWTVANTTIRDVTFGIVAGPDPVGGNRASADGSWSVRDTSIEDAEYGLWAARADGPWAVTDSRIRGGVTAANTEGNWSIDGTEITNSATGYSEVALDARSTGGDWRVVDSTIGPAPTTGIDAETSTGDWLVANTTVSNIYDAESAESGGIVAVRSKGDWLVRNNTVLDTASQGISADEATGDWRIEGTAIARNDRRGLSALAAAGGRIVDSAILANGDAGVNATAASTTVDATDNWWGVAAGPTAEQCVGNVDCGDWLTSAPEQFENLSPVTDIVVAADGSEDYRSIQNAIDAARPGSEIEVRPGTYPEAVTIDKNVTLVAPDGATIDGSATATAGITIQSERPIDPTIDGFRITNWERGIEAPDADGDWAIANTTVRDTEFGILAGPDPVGGARAPADGAWSVRNSSVEASVAGLFAIQTNGSWSVTDSRIRGGVDASNAEGSWSISNSDLSIESSDSGDIALDARSTEGDWRVTDTAIGPTPGAGIDAANAAGNWTVVDSRIVDSAAHGVVADSTAGDWRIDHTVLGRNGPSGVSAIRASGGRIVDSAILANADAGVNATRAKATVDATGNWWGQAAGPTSDQCVGNVDCSDSLDDLPDGLEGVAPPDTIVVAKDGSGDYRSIQNAVDNASEGATITVEDGTYEESVVVSKNITLTTDRAVVEPAFPTKVGFTIPAESRVSPTIRGFTIRGRFYDAGMVGVRAGSTAGDWRLRNVSITDAELGVDAANTTGSWSIEGGVVAGARRGIDARNATGGPTVTRSAIVENEIGLDATGASPRVDARENWWGPGEGPTSNQCVGNATCTDPLSTWPGAGDGTLVVSADGAGEFSQLSTAVYVAPEGTTIRVLSGTYQETVVVPNNVTVTTETAVVAPGPQSPAFQIPEDSAAAPTLRGFTVRGDYYVTGVDARGTRGDWTVSHFNASDIFAGIDAPSTTGDWTVRNSKLARNARGVFAAEATGQPRIRDSIIVNNTNVGINGEQATPGIDATQNYWGPGEGPASDQCVGNVTCSEPLTDPPIVDIPGT
jgi:pectin methylesterase-like acyl-CoA thioesterase